MQNLHPLSSWSFFEMKKKIQYKSHRMHWILKFDFEFKAEQCDITLGKHLNKNLEIPKRFVHIKQFLFRYVFRRILRDWWIYPYSWRADRFHHGRRTLQKLYGFFHKGGLYFHHIWFVFLNWLKHIPSWNFFRKKKFIVASKTNHQTSITRTRIMVNNFPNFVFKQ